MDLNLNLNHIIDSLGETEKINIIVFGDYALDKYLYIDPARDEISVETGKTAYQVDRKQCFAGVGGTITNNLRALGVNVTCIGILGNDGEGLELGKCLSGEGADISHMVRTDSLCTSTYVKPMRKNKDGGYSEMNRLDFRNFQEPSAEIQNKLLDNLEKVLDYSDGVIITDQFVQRNMGTVTDSIRKSVSKMAAEHKDKIFYVDSRAFADEYRNMIVKCNNSELSALQDNMPGNPEDMEYLEKCGMKLRKQNNVDLYVTCGSKGILVFNGEKVTPVRAYPVKGPIDIVGAGDASNAGIVMGLSLGLNMAEAAMLACCISSITIQQIGTTGTSDIPSLKKRILEYGEELKNE